MRSVDPRGLHAILGSEDCLFEQLPEVLLVHVVGIKRRESERAAIEAHATPGLRTNKKQTNASGILRPDELPNFAHHVASPAPLLVEANDDDRVRAVDVLL